MTPFLILHKVRGQPAFDIAHEMAIGDEIGWVCSTSGHRAYPYLQWPIGTPIDVPTVLGSCEGPDWHLLPDHYDVLPTAPKGTVDDIMKLFSIQPVVESNGTRMRR